MHKLLDTAAFVSILQELVGHEQARVRQTALFILGQRLERMSSSRHIGGDERSLYLELAGQLRKSVLEADPRVTASPVEKKLPAGKGRPRSRSRSSSLDSVDTHDGRQTRGYRPCPVSLDVPRLACKAHGQEQGLGRAIDRDVAGAH